MSSRESHPKLVPSCRNPRGMARHSSFAAIVRTYVVHNRPRALEDLSGFENEPTLQAAIERAGMAERPDGKRYDHQRRIPREVLRNATARLRNAPLAMAEDFDSVLGMVINAIGQIHGIGELTVYDTALRIGAKLGVLPTRVYLHSGTRTGARALGLNWQAPYLELEDCPAELRVLTPHEIEDCLCIFKRRFPALKRARLAWPPKVGAILDAAERRIDKGAGIPHDEFWKQVKSANRAREANGREKKRRTKRRTK